ncbi:MAG: hypothetical protein AAF224_09345 [Pseudomonadota bacterium]
MENTLPSEDVNAIVDSTPTPAPKWAAYGYIGRGAPSAQNLIDIYETRRACEAGVDTWASRQVAGTLVWGECLPADEN